MKLYKQSNFFKIKNINNSKNYRRIITFIGLKFKIKNKGKIAFFENKLKKAKEELYYKRVELLKQLKPYRENQDYILTCYLITYNQEYCISRAIESILEQKTKYKYLIKILDDCSTDKTFDICYEYAKKYPDKIELITAKQNHRGKLRTVLYENIETPYFCRLDGDDYWCDSSKIEVSIDFLEKNKDYVTYAHNYCKHNVITGKKIYCDYVVGNEITFENFHPLQVSSRIHRNVIDFANEYKYVRKEDNILFFLFLSKGRMYYDNRVMSVWTIHPNGLWGGIPSFYQFLQKDIKAYYLNKLLDFKYDTCFTKWVNNKTLKLYKKLFGKKLGWEFYIFYIRYFSCFKFAIKCVFNSVKYCFDLTKGSVSYLNDHTENELCICREELYKNQDINIRNQNYCEQENFSGGES